MRRCPVVCLHKDSTQHTPGAEDVIYRRGKPAQACTLIISGKVEVLAGSDGFRSEMGPFAVLGADALLVKDGGGGYVPDFTATVSSESLRFLRITAEDCVCVPKPTKMLRGATNSAKVAIRKVLYGISW